MGLPPPAEDQQHARADLTPKRRPQADDTVTISPERARQMELHLSQVPDRLRYDLPGLMADVTRAARAPPEVAYLLYLWLTRNLVYDVEDYLAKIRTRSDCPDLPQMGTFEADRELARQTFYSGKGLCAGYAALFQVCCKLSGLPCVRIPGTVNPGSALINVWPAARAPNHVWNAVHVSGDWRLVDTCWGAGYLSQASGDYVSQPTDHYFCTPPPEFARDHLPADPRWQLLASPVTASDFHTSLCVKPGYFQLGVTECNVQTSHVTCKDRYSFRIGYSRPLYVTYEVRHDDVTGSLVNSFLHMEVSRVEAVLTLLAPRAGRYLVVVCASDRDRPCAVRRLLEFTVSCERPYTAALPLTRLCSQHTPTAWGPTGVFHWLGLRFLAPFQSVLRSGAGSVCVRLSTPRTGARYHGEVQAGGRVRRGCVRVEDADGEVAFLVGLPEPGVYRLAMFGKAVDMDSYKLICSMVVVCICASR